MKIRSIVLYGVKSERKNAKCNYKHWDVFQGDNNANVKRKFTEDMDLADMKDWLGQNEYSKFRMIVWDGNENLHSWGTKVFYSKESALQRATAFARLFNGEED